MKLVSFVKIIVSVFILLASCKIGSDSSKNENLDQLKSKELYIPDTVYMVPDNNDFKSDTSEFCFSRMKETNNIALFWAKEYGVDPLTNPDSTKRFDVDKLLSEGERIYNYYVNKLKFVNKGNSITDKYKMLIIIFGGEEGTAFGGGERDTVGVLWATSKRVGKTPYGALAHEMGHSFQYLLHADGYWAYTSTPEGSWGNTIFEMTSQYMLWQVYPEWMTFENYHLVDFMKQTHYSFLHEVNQYHSPYVLEYWSNKHGVEFIGKLWKEAKEGEDPVITYKRITSIDQVTFNDEIFDAACRFITWDMKRIEYVAKPYANQHSCKLNSIGDGWYQIDKSRCPQNYGYNGIRLKVPYPGTTVVLDFKGMVGEEGYRSVQPEKAGWRYGFVALMEDGKRTYGHINSKSNGQTSFIVPANTAYLWLVVTGAPSEHWVHLVDGKEDNDEQWPYKIKLAGTTLDEKVIN